MERTVITCDKCTGKNPKMAVERFLVKGLTSGKSFTVDLCGWHKGNFFPTNMQATTGVNTRSMQEALLGADAAEDVEEKKEVAVELPPRKRNLTYGRFPCPDPECRKREPFDTKQGLTLHTLRVHRQISTKKKIAV